MSRTYALLFLVFIHLLKGYAQNKTPNSKSPILYHKLEAYLKAYKDNGLESISTGAVEAGSLINGKLMPFSGKNYHYFDTLSYISDRAYVHQHVKTAVLETYQQLELSTPNRTFFLMECSYKNGGKLFPHRTHQNGLSIDFMVPLIKNKNPYDGLDTIGRKHYFLEFDDLGRYSKDSTISIDFELIATHILLLEIQAKKNHLKISKVIFKLELKDDLYAGPEGQKLKKSGIYLAKQLTPLINSLHDDHYHIDFEEVK